MQPLNPLKTSAYSTAQRFFAEKLIEMLHSKTIDTYRARVMNPRTIIIECTELIKEILRGRIPNKKAIIYAAEEAKQLLKDEKSSYLNFAPLSHATVLSNIGSLFQDEKSGKLSPEKLKRILVTLKNFSLNDNKDYAKALINQIESLIAGYDNTQDISANQSILEEISTLSNYFLTELLYKGYTKTYLYRRVSDIFNSNKTRDFSVAFKKLKNLLTIHLPLIRWSLR